jgi:hypothetical protein
MPSSHVHASWTDRGSHMRRLTATFVLSLCLLGCQSERPVVPPSGDPVQLLTNPDPPRGCVLMSNIVGTLMVDSKFGTAIQDGPNSVTPIMWPRGYLGRRVGTEVQAFDAGGKLVAVTGKSYEFLPVDVSLNGGAGNPLVACGVLRPSALSSPWRS